MSNTVSHLRPLSVSQSTRMDGGGGDGYDDNMEKRVEKLEALMEKSTAKLTQLEVDVAVIKSNYATKTDVAEAKTSIILWVVSAIIFAQLLPSLLRLFGVGVTP